MVALLVTGPLLVTLLVVVKGPVMVVVARFDGPKTVRVLLTVRFSVVVVPVMVASPSMVVVAKVDVPKTVKVLLTVRFSTAKLVRSTVMPEKSRVRVLPPEMARVMVLFALMGEAVKV